MTYYGMEIVYTVNSHQQRGTLVSIEANHPSLDHRDPQGLPGAGIFSVRAPALPARGCIRVGQYQSIRICTMYISNSSLTNERIRKHGRNSLN